jgi:competence protein ComEC
MQIGKILVSTTDMLVNYSPFQCKKGQSWTWDQVRFEILSPMSDILSGENDNSCVLKISSKQGKILLTGDIEALAEDWLINNYPTQLSSDVMIAPHHGSKTSSTLRFLKQVAPTIILIPAGYRNRFGFPHQDVLQRYKTIKASVYNVADEGAVSVEIKNNSFVVDSIRSEQGRYWNN